MNVRVGRIWTHRDLQEPLQSARLGAVPVDDLRPHGEGRHVGELLPAATCGQA